MPDIEVGSTTNAADISQSLLDAWNSRDLDGFVQLLSEDVQWYDPAMPQPPIHGRAAVMEFAEAVFEAFPDFRYEVNPPICVSSDGSRCAIVWRISATHMKPLRPLGFAPTGRRATFDGVDVVDVLAGKVVRIQTAFDAISAAEQLLGVSLRPRPGTWHARIAVAVQRIAAWISRRGRRTV